MAWVTLDSPPFDVLGTLPGVRIVDVAGANPAGKGVLRIATGELLSWRAPKSATFGSTVDVGAGGTFILEDGTDTDHWVRVTVIAASLPSGCQEVLVELRELFNETVAGADVTAAEASSGDVSSWDFNFASLNTDAVTLAVWLDVYSAQRFEISHNGVAWVAPTAEGSGLALTLPADGQVALYVRRTIAAGAASSPGKRLRILWSGTVAPTTEYGEVRAWVRIFNTANYRLYRRNAALLPRPTASPTATFTSGELPYTVDEALGDGEWTYVVRRFNGVLEAPVGDVERLWLVSAASVALRPADAQELWLEARAGGVVRVHGYYPTERDDSTCRATNWAIWFSNATPASFTDDPNYTPDVESRRGYALLAYDLPAQSEGTLVSVLLKMRRGTAPSEVDSATALSDSIDAEVDGPAVPAGAGRGLP